MKHILGIAIVALIMASCNQKHCWNCRIDYKNSVQFGTNGQAGTGVKTLGVCDKTKKEIDQYEADNSIDDPANNLKKIEDDFLHTQFWALVNRKGEVKKVYDG